MLEQERATAWARVSGSHDYHEIITIADGGVLAECGARWSTSESEGDVVAIPPKGETCKTCLCSSLVDRIRAALAGIDETNDPEIRERVYRTLLVHVRARHGFVFGELSDLGPPTEPISDPRLRARGTGPVVIPEKR